MSSRQNNSIPESVPARDDVNGLVAVEVADGRAALYHRRGDSIVISHEPFSPFLFVEQKALSKIQSLCSETRHLRGPGRLNTLALFPSTEDWNRARKKLAVTRGPTPFLAVNDRVQQHLLLTGRSLFGGMHFEQLRRMQVDIETHTAPGFEFCNPERERDRIIIIAMSDDSGWEEALWAPDGDEKGMLERFVARVRERDPDVIEGHNFFKFDLAYIAARAAMHGVKLALGREGGLVRSSSGNYTAGERMISYPKFEIPGRHIVDTMFLLHAYDVSHRSLESHGLKYAASYFNVSGPDRVFIKGSEISSVFDHDPELVLRYSLDDVRETRALANILARSVFIQAGMLPMGYQAACVRGNGAKIDALMMRAYINAGCALPDPEKPRDFQGGYTDIFMQGVVENVHHCDARSLYPSIMLSRKIAPKSDHLGAFLDLLEQFRDLRFRAKDSMQSARNSAERMHFDSQQSALKILINSFYGYLGFAQGRFNDFDAAEKVASEGRSILSGMVAWLREHGAKPVEIDTDGVYFVPPAFRAKGELEKFREALRQSLPDGIEVEFDGEYRTMFSYKMKNYALLDHDGSFVIRGAALKSRGMEPYLRAFLKDMIRLKLELKDSEIPDLKTKCEKAILDGTLGIQRLAKTEVLKEAPASYAVKIEAGGRGRNAAYEIALHSGHPYQAGDQVSYYITGKAKKVSAHSSAKLVSEWNPAARDENTAYYVAKLEALYKRFTAGESADA